MIHASFEIDENKKLFMIQEEFNNAFPYLKLAFFMRSGRLESDFILARWLFNQTNKTLKECRTLISNLHVTIEPQMTVLDLDQQFQKAYGIGVLVYRRSGKVWLETTLTDAWTLEEQNWQGEALSA